MRAITALARTQMFVATPQISMESKGRRTSSSREHPKVSFSMTVHLPMRTMSHTRPWSFHPSVPLMQCSTGSITPSRVRR